MFRQLKRIRMLQDGQFPLLALILIEFTAIVLAVMLGLMANDWRENRQNSALADKALESLAREMSYNHQQIVSQYLYYSRFVAEFREILISGEVDAPSALYAYELEAWNGAMPPMLRSSSYDMMVNTGVIAHLPFETVDKLAFIYNMQTAVDRVEDAYIAATATNTDGFKADFAAHSFALFSEIMPSLLGTYQHLGKPILEPHGYNLDIEDERLTNHIEREKAWLEELLLQ